MSYILSLVDVGESKWNKVRINCAFGQRLLLFFIELIRKIAKIICCYVRFERSNGERNIEDIFNFFPQYFCASRVVVNIDLFSRGWDYSRNIEDYNFLIVSSKRSNQGAGQIKLKSFLSKNLPLVSNNSNETILLFILFRYFSRWGRESNEQASLARTISANRMQNHIYSGGREGRHPLKHVDN